MSDNEPEYGGDDYDFDVHGYESDDEALTVNVNNDKLPLIPSEYPSLDEALQTFVAVFESRYGGLHPPFMITPLQTAVTEAFECPGRDVSERRPFAMYIHNDNSVAANIFATQVMCSDAVSSLLQGQYITWAWDITYPENKARLNDWLTMLGMNQINETTRYVPKDKYPLLLVIVKDHGTYTLAQLITGQDSVDVALTKLIEGIDTYANVRNRALQEERARIEREQIRAEQVAAYEESKAADKAKQEEKEKIAKQEKEAEETRRREEQEALEKQERLKAHVPPEPAADAKDVIMIRLRSPDGSQHIRRFKMDEKVKFLVIYCESLGFDKEKYRLFTSDVPKKDVATLDNEKTFKELKWPPREQITIDENLSSVILVQNKKSNCVFFTTFKCLPETGLVARRLILCSSKYSLFNDRFLTD
uniref:UBX domain-containing protein n=1 Tax=Panagrolaimus sp. JU765 TaxID=591449 RepID=A0AC34QE48_9BILA